MVANPDTAAATPIIPLVVNGKEKHYPTTRDMFMAALNSGRADPGKQFNRRDHYKFVAWIAPVGNYPECLVGLDAFCPRANTYTFVEVASKDINPDQIMFRYDEYGGLDIYSAPQSATTQSLRALVEEMGRKSEISLGQSFLNGRLKVVSLNGNSGSLALSGKDVLRNVGLVTDTVVSAESLSFPGDDKS
jgi:hypothetical protein